MPEKQSARDVNLGLALQLHSRRATALICRGDAEGGVAALSQAVAVYEQQRKPDVDDREEVSRCLCMLLALHKAADRQEEAESCLQQLQSFEKELSERGGREEAERSGDANVKQMQRIAAHYQEKQSTGAVPAAWSQTAGWWRLICGDDTVYTNVGDGAKQRLSRRPPPGVDTDSLPAEMIRPGEEWQIRFSLANILDEWPDKPPSKSLAVRSFLSLSAADSVSVCAQPPRPRMLWCVPSGRSSRTTTRTRRSSLARPAPTQASSASRALVASLPSSARWKSTRSTMSCRLRAAWCSGSSSWTPSRSALRAATSPRADTTHAD